MKPGFRSATRRDASWRKVIDLFGLVTPEAVPYRDRPGGAVEFVALMKPDYVIIFPNWFPDLARREELIPLFTVFLETNAVCGGQMMGVYKTVWAEDQCEVASGLDGGESGPDS